MAQTFAPEVWMEIDQNKDLVSPSVHTRDLFTAQSKICVESDITRVYGPNHSDYITTYDDRRLNGLAKAALGISQDTSTQAVTTTYGYANDGWGASAYGIFQDVRYDSYVYTMTRNRSSAWRIFDEVQYAGDIGVFGNESKSSAYTKSYDSVSKVLMDEVNWWKENVLGPDEDTYNMFAICNGHMAGRWVTNSAYDGMVFDGDCAKGQWVASPGPVTGESIPPRFAPIHCIEWDLDNLPLMLKTVTVTWNNMRIPENDRVLVINENYEYDFMTALTGRGIPVTEAAFDTLQNGKFTKLMGWELDFTVPDYAWPYLYLDANLNVVHTANGQAAYDQIINSIDANNEPDSRLKLLRKLTASNRMSQFNTITTYWDDTNKKLKKRVTNYPFGSPAYAHYLGEGITIADGEVATWDSSTGLGGISAQWASSDYPWDGQAGGGIGLLPHDSTHSGSAYATGPVTPITKTKVIGLFLYKKAGQLSQHYEDMYTEEGHTRGKFTEAVVSAKYDAWVIEHLSHGILPIVDVTNAEPSVPAIRVELAGGVAGTYTSPIPITGATLTYNSTDGLTVTPTWQNGASPTSPTYSCKWYVDGVDKASSFSATTSLTVSKATLDNVITASGTYKIYVVVTASGTGQGTTHTNEITYTKA